MTDWRLDRPQLFDVSKRRFGKLSLMLAPLPSLPPLLALAIALAPAGARADCADPFGKPNERLDFHIKITRADWAGLLASRVPSTDGNRGACDAKYPEFKAEFRCGTEGAWLKIALRKKRGEERGVEAPQKPPLKIDFNEDFMGMVPEAKGQRWPAAFGDFGYRKLTLNNGQGNKPPGRMLILPNLLSEHVALRLLSKEVPTSPRTAIAQVTLHFEDKPEGEFHGAYVLIEDIDKTALKRRFGRGDGRLVKASKAGCPIEVQFDDGPPNEAKASYDAFIGKAGGLADAEKGVELDSVLRQEAIREILVNGDDTLFYGGGEGNNWYSFDPRMGKRHYMPWDVDLTFGQQQQNCAPNSLKCLPTFPLLRFCRGSRLGSATACNTEVQKRYLQIMCQLTQGSLSADEIIKVWDEADKVARPAVAMEKDLIWRGMDPLSTAIDKSYGAEYVRLRSWIPERVKSVQQQITAKGIACAPGCTAGAKESCQYLTCPGERACVDNIWTECRPMAGCALPSPSPAGGDGGVPSGSGNGGDAGGAVSDAGTSVGSGGTTGGNGGSGGGASGTPGNPGSGGTAGSGGGTTSPSGSGGNTAGGAGSGGKSGKGGSGGTAGTGPAARPQPAGGGKSGGCSLAAGPGQTSHGVPMMPIAFALSVLGVIILRHRGRAQR